MRRLLIILCALFQLSCSNFDSNAEANKDSLYYTYNPDIPLLLINLDQIDELDSVNTKLLDTPTYLHTQHEYLEAKKLRQLLDSLEIEIFYGDTLYIAFGDILMDKEEIIKTFYLDKYLFRQGFQKFQLDRPLLLTETKNDYCLKWHKDYISYAFDKHSFSHLTKEKFISFEKAFKTAATDWQGLSGVQFQYLKSYNSSRNFRKLLKNNKIDLVIKSSEIDKKGYYASATLPRKRNRNRLNVTVHRQFFKQKRYNHEGVFRHELGHILGFRHEFIDSTDFQHCSYDERISRRSRFRILDTFDRYSVMQYDCDHNGNVIGSPNLEFSRIDSIGIHFYYFQMDCSGFLTE